MRTCDRWDNSLKQFLSYRFSELKQGDEFRLFDDEEPVLDCNGFSCWTALSDAYENDEGIWQIDIRDSLLEK